MNEQARIRAAIARHPYDKCISCGSTFKVEGLVDVREDIPLQRLATAMGTQICRLQSPHSCEAVWSDFKPARTGGPGRRDAPVAATRRGHQVNRSGGSVSGPRADGDDEDRRIWQLLDQAIQETARSEFDRLDEGLIRKEDVKRKVESALESVDRLRTGGVPDYHDPWTAVFYLTWYQPRQVNLIYSHLKSSNARLPQGLRVVDLGCGFLGDNVRIGCLRSNKRAARAAHFRARYRQQPSDAATGIAALGAFLEADSPGGKALVWKRHSWTYESRDREDEPGLRTAGRLVARHA